MSDETKSHLGGEEPTHGPGGLEDDAPTELAPSAYSAPAGYESATQTAGPSHVQQNAQWAAYSSPGQHQGYATGPHPQYQTTPYGSVPSHSGAQVAPAPRKRTAVTGWLIGIILVLAAIAGFGLVWFFMPNDKSSDTAANSPTAKASNGVVHSSQTSVTPSSSDVTDPFPLNATTSCESWNGENSLKQNEQAMGSITCDFADQITNDARKELATAPNATSFVLADEYSVPTTHTYNVTCNVHNHLVTCSTYSQNGDGKMLGVYFHDNN